MQTISEGRCDGDTAATGWDRLAGMAQILRFLPTAQLRIEDASGYYGLTGIQCRWNVPKKASGWIPLENYEGSEAIRVKHVASQGCDYWFYKKKLYVTSDIDLTPGDVAALIDESGNRRRLQLEKAHALQSMNTELSKGPRRAHIPQDVKVVVWQRDGGRCISCAAQSDLEFDHIIPVALGGSDTIRNLQLLCEPCNRRKGASLG